MSVLGTILVVDDDQRLCRLVSRYLHREGYEVRTATSAAEMRLVMQANDPELVILDLMLPDGDGFELARELRAQSDVGIVILTGKTDTVDKVVGLEIGADDYMTKPFEPRELLARIHSVLRRRTAGQAGEGRGSLAHFGGWSLDLEAYELRADDGSSVNLTTHEFRLLSALVTHGQRVLTRDAILDSVFDRDWSPEDRSIDVLVGKLRKKLGDDAKDPAVIRTIRGAGYALIPSVHFSDAGSSDVSLTGRETGNGRFTPNRKS